MKQMMRMRENDGAYDEETLNRTTREKERRWI